MNMAKRKYSKMKKIEPSIQTMVFQVPSIEGGRSGTSYIDLSQCASILNRRFYRQGLNWAVSGFKVLSNAFEGYIQISKLPNTWVMSNSWEKGFRAWKQQQDEALDEGTQESVKAKFNDFKIHADSLHIESDFSANLLPFDASAVVATPGEWEASQIVIPNFQTVGTNIEPYIRAVGAFDLTADSTQFSLIEAYANSRSVPQSPDPAVPADVLSDTANVYRAMFDVGDNDDQVMDNAVGKNDNLPYPQTQYPGGDTQLTALQFHDAEYVTATTVGGTTRFAGSNFPCGLIRFDYNNTGSTTTGFTLKIDLVPGNHRGYLCEPMTEM